MKKSRFLNSASLRFFAGFTEASLEASRVRPGERVSDEFPANTSGRTLIRPGGRACYPAVWTQDFAITLATGFVTPQEMSGHLDLIAKAQNGAKERRLKSGAIIPPFAIPDHVLFNGEAVFYLGTYSSAQDQGGEPWGIVPPTCNHYDFILIAWHLWRATKKSGFLREKVNGLAMIERLRLAFAVPRSDPSNGLIYTDARRRAVGFIFCDSIYMTGHLLFASLLRWRAGRQLAELEAALGKFSGGLNVFGCGALILGNFLIGLLMDWTHSNYRMAFLWTAAITGMAIYPMILVIRGWEQHGGHDGYVAPLPE